MIKAMLSIVLGLSNLSQAATQTLHFRQTGYGFIFCFLSLASSLEEWRLTSSAANRENVQLQGQGRQMRQNCLDRSNLPILFGIWFNPFAVAFFIFISVTLPNILTNRTCIHRNKGHLSAELNRFSRIRLFLRHPANLLQI
jgi:hypothetical protein